MKQVLTILKFEFLNIVSKKGFIIFTIILSLLLAGVFSAPNIINIVKGSSNKVQKNEIKKGTKIAISGFSQGEKDLAFLKKSLPHLEITLDNSSKEDIVKKIKSEKYDSAIYRKSPLEYEYITTSIGMTDMTHSTVEKALNNLYKINEIKSLGIDEDKAGSIVTSDIKIQPVELGTSQQKNFFFTYIMIFGLYMAILVYGQQIAMSVAAEKTSRAIEVLITSAKPSNLIFGKVLGSGLAGLFQIAILGTVGFTFYTINKESLKLNEMMSFIFSITPSSIIFAVVFFILGYTIYAFLFGALGSLVSRTEDIGSSVMPVTLVFIGTFLLVITSMTSGKIDSLPMVIASYFPFTSPMAMFSRITMGQVSSIGIAASIIILILSTIVIGYVSAKIYKKGILVFGKTIKLTQINKIKS